MLIELKWARDGRVFQYVAMLTGTLCIVSSGMHYGWPSPSLPQLQHPNSTLPVTNEEGSWLAVMPLFGASIGSLFGIVVLDRIGRKRAILLCGLPSFAAWIMVATADTVATLLFARIVAGFGDGLSFCAIPMYLNEIADPEVRGFLGSSCATALILGMLLISVVGSYASMANAALVCSLAPLLLLVTFPWMPESPYYLIMRGRQADAAKSLRIFRGATFDVDGELRRLSSAIKNQSLDAGKILDLFTVRANRKAGIIALGMQTIQQCSGMMAIAFYAHSIFETAGSAWSPVTAAIIYFALQVVFSVVSSMIMDRTGRRPLLVISIVGAGLSLFVEGLYFYLKFDYPYVPVAALISFVVHFSLGLQTIPTLLLGELFSTNVKAFALSLADVHFNLAAILVSKFFQAVKDSYGMHIPFFAFSASCVVGLVFVVRYVPETKGKTLEEIQDELRGGRARPDDDGSTRQVETLRKIVSETIDICNNVQK